MKRVKISPTQIQQIKDAVTSAEKKTSGEILPILLPASDPYWFTYFAGGFLGGGAATVIELAEIYVTGWPKSIPEVVFCQAFGFSIGIALAFLPFVKRLLIPKFWLAQRVHQRCLASFVSYGLAETRDRTGVLIFISLLERRVEILADKGIHTKLPKGYWETQVKELVSGIHQGMWVEALCKVIGHIGEKLADHFPPRADDTDEIPNDPITPPS